MLIALVVALGIDLLLLGGLLALGLLRRRWVMGQPGGFTGEIRLASGDLAGLSTTWRRGSGRWVNDVLVWSRAPLMIHNDLIPVDRVVGARLANAGEAERLGDGPLILELASGTATVELAARPEDRALAAGPMT